MLSFLIHEETVGALGLSSYVIIAKSVGVGIYFLFLIFYRPFFVLFGGVEAPLCFLSNSIRLAFQKKKTKGVARDIEKTNRRVEN